VIFNLNYTDAKDVSAMATELSTTDFMTLPRYHIYAHLQNNRKSTGWISGATLPAPPIIRNPAELKATSTALYGQSSETAETPDLTVSEQSTTNIGRKIII
jgi:hypothetical protein